MVLSTEGKLAHEMAFNHNVTKCTKFKTRICLHVHVVHFCSVMCVGSIVGVSGEVLKNFCASCNVTVVQRIFFNVDLALPSSVEWTASSIGMQQ
jgi:hypothetical protein